MASDSSNFPRPFGPYELVRQITVGGMAEVFVATARSIAGFEKTVVLKVIHPQVSDDPEFTRLLIEEANITARLSHRNIVQVLDLGQNDGSHYIAMEFVEGLDLGKLLSRLRERGTRASPRLAAYVVREVCEGLDHAHRKADTAGRALEIIHRDVSPGNILLSLAGEVKLTDFGLARAAVRASATRAGAVKGQYAYMAPEQARGGSIDARVDLFAAGAVLYEMLAGRTLHGDASTADLLARVTAARFDPIETVRSDVPAAIAAIVRKALAANPAQRYPTARSMVDDLNGFLYSLPPNPEFELSQLLSGMSAPQPSPVGPKAASSSLFDEDEEEPATQVQGLKAIQKAAAAAATPAACSDSDGFDDRPTQAVPADMIPQEPTKTQRTPTPAPPSVPTAAATGKAPLPVRSGAPAPPRPAPSARAAPPPSRPGPPLPMRRASVPPVPSAAAGVQTPSLPSARVAPSPPAVSKVPRVGAAPPAPHSPESQPVSEPRAVQPSAPRDPARTSPTASPSMPAVSTTQRSAAPTESPAAPTLARDPLADPKSDASPPAVAPAPPASAVAMAAPSAVTAPYAAQSPAVPQAIPTGHGDSAGARPHVAAPAQSRSVVMAGIFAVFGIGILVLVLVITR